MISRKISRSIKTRITDYPALKLQALGTLALVAVVSLSGCGKQMSTDAKVVRSLPLVKVNDVEIGMMQPIDDLKPVEGKAAATKEPVNKEFLETLIDRQLLQDEAMRNKLDRDPQVIQAIDRAKTQILAQAYLQSKFVKIEAPSKAEIDAYFKAHPELFTQRKVYIMKELVVATKDFSAQLKSKLDSARSIEEVAAWLDKNQVKFERAQLSRSTADLAPEMIKKLQTMRRNQLFVSRAGEYSMLNSVSDVKPDPVTSEVAAPQIELYLRNKKRKEFGDVELVRLRALANIEYLNKKQLASSAASAAKLAGSPKTTRIENGMPGPAK